MYPNLQTVFPKPIFNSQASLYNNRNETRLKNQIQAEEPEKDRFF